jgi:hypothetical protein
VKRRAREQKQENCARAMEVGQAEDASRVKDESEDRGGDRHEDRGRDEG